MQFATVFRVPATHHWFHSIEHMEKTETHLLLVKLPPSGVVPDFFPEHVAPIERMIIIFLAKMRSLGYPPFFTNMKLLVIQICHDMPLYYTPYLLKSSDILWLPSRTSIAPFPSLASGPAQAEVQHTAPVCAPPGVVPRPWRSRAAEQWKLLGGFNALKDMNVIGDHPSKIWLKAANHFAILRLSLLGLFWSKTLGISWCIHDFFGVNFEIWKPNLEILCLASDHAENTHGRPTCHWKIAINRTHEKPVVSWASRLFPTIFKATLPSFFCFPFHFHWVRGFEFVAHFPRPTHQKR